MNFQELVGKLQLHFESASGEDDAFVEFGNDYCQGYYGSDIPEVGNAELVYSQGGSDKGSQWERVLYFKDHDIYLQIEGYYSSYEGVDFQGESWDALQQVYPYQKTITLYSTNKQLTNE